MKSQRRQQAGKLLFGGNKKKPSMAQPRPEIEVPENGIGPVYEVNDHDVLSGRGGKINAHAGNVRFRQIIHDRRPEYLDPNLKKLDKAWVAADVVRRIRAQGGRFLKQQGSDGAWWDIGDAKAIKKVGQALREEAKDVREELAQNIVLQVGIAEQEDSFDPIVPHPPPNQQFRAAGMPADPGVDSAFGHVFHPAEVHAEPAGSMISGLSNPSFLSSFSGLTRQLSAGKQTYEEPSVATLTPMDLTSLPSLPVTVLNNPRTSTLSSFPSINTAALNEGAWGLTDRQAMPAPPARMNHRSNSHGTSDMSWADNSLMGGGIDKDPTPKQTYSSNMSVASRSVDDGMSQISEGLMSLDVANGSDRQRKQG